MGTQTYTNVGGVWKKNNKIHTNVSSTWKEVKKGYVNIGGVWKQIHSSGGGILPTGIILPYSSSSAVPTGFDEYTDASDKYIVGAGNSYTVSSTGGSTSISVGSTSSSNGSHTGTTFYTGQVKSGKTGGKTNYASGNHSHTVSLASSVEPEYKTLRLIKSNQDVSEVPIDTCVLSSSVLTNGMTVETSSNRFMKASTTYNSTGGSYSVSLSGTTSTSGSHSHTVSYPMGSSDESYWYVYNHNQGGHSHSITLVGTLTPVYKYLSLWKNATAATPITPSIIAMWESLTPPEGWALCDGTNGTPDMRDYFLRLGDETNHGTSGGASTLDLVGTTTTGGSHQHRGVSINNSYSGSIVYHSNTVSMAGHTFSWSSTYTPPYKALAFIMKLDA